MKKKKMNFRLTLLLILLFCIINSLTVLAEEEKVRASPSDLPLTDSGDYINTYMPETLSDKKSDSEDENLAPLSVEESFKDVQETADYMRSKMVNRVQSFSFLFNSSNDNWREINNAVIKKCIGTDSSTAPNEGDYLKYQYKRYKVNVAYYPPADGIYNYVFTYHFTYYTSLSEENEVSDKIAEIFHEYHIDTLSEYEKIETIYSYICANVSYEYDASADYRYTAYGALISGKAVCQGYANLLFRMMREAGINSRIISGTANNVLHTWNIVCLKKSYYYLDATWDAIYPEGLWNAFLKGVSSSFSIEHQSKEEFLTSEFTSLYPLSPYDANGWFENNGHTYYYCQGDKSTGWQNIDGNTYYFSKADYRKGDMLTGVTQIDNHIFYFQSWGDKRGAMYKGWIKINGLTYYFNAQGEMLTGWNRITDNLYYFSKTGGYMYMGFAEIADKKYYFSMANYRKGVALTGLTQIGTNYYYFLPSGYTGERKIGSKTWVFDQGKCINIISGSI